MEVQSIFPTPIGIFKLPRELSQEEKNILLNQEVRKNVHNLVSVNSKILELPELEDLKSFCLESLNEYFNTIYNPKEPIEIYITQSWLNYTKENESHHSHEHSNSLISGVFYVQVDKERGDCIQFLKNRYQTLMIPTKQLNQFNSELIDVFVDELELVFFPSHIAHQVKSIKGDTTRISLAFNSFIKGKLGDEEGLTELYLGD
jgi:uncharacterized protein (TIGR02466 family)